LSNRSRQATRHRPPTAIAHRPRPASIDSRNECSSGQTPWNYSCVGLSEHVGERLRLGSRSWGRFEPTAVSSGRRSQWYVTGSHHFH
jgi:hypothetical protein